MSKKKLVIMNLAFMIGLGSSFAIPSVKAETNIQQQRSEIQKDIANADQELQKVKAELDKLNEQIVRVDQAIADNNKKIEQTKKDITVANEEISTMESEITQLEKSIENRTEILKERAISFQHSGGNIDYFDVLIGSSSFGDFVNRAIAVGKIVEADQNLLDEHVADEKTLKESKAAKVNKLADLTNMKEELEGMQALTLEQKAQNDELKKQLQNEETATLAAKNSLQQRDMNLASQIVVSNEDSSTSEARNSQASSSVELASGTKFENTPVNPNGTVNDLITAGYKYIGNSVYIFGGGRNAYDVANGRFDCSGFVHWAFSTVGVSVGASTDSLKNSGTRISPSNMQPGDLVFFNTYKTDGHVGIYMGGGKFIGSQSSTGVAIANMSSGYWADTFSGRVVRINL
ncbi:peptidoglycan hydrolase CwlO-like protein [Metabacillus crassostreae]|uniref:coiled-coil domain-containing protein n=1 Tax=Metabacillus crassostreae TaxID=929098 RepID=UPI00195A9A06|nr:C40 family peptidase [Metabacillus crassostreae]MBM7605904.1 peptidoglycan hydrolase CwlO-like protein [Metabacillus crassostreae]